MDDLLDALKAQLDALRDMSLAAYEAGFAEGKHQARMEIEKDLDKAKALHSDVLRTQ